MAPYLNAGVLMINLDWWRTNGVSKTILDYLAKNHSTNRYADQDGINAILSPYAQLLHPQWNVPGYLDFDNHWGFVECPRAKSWLDACRSRLVDESAIIHFIGKRKPWDFRLSGDKLQMQWLQAFSKCQFDGFIPTLYTSMLARLGQVKRLLIKA
jgi:lipopolysaccharide biosynthesis glycosyltransferase